MTRRNRFSAASLRVATTIGVIVLWILSVLHRPFEFDAVSSSYKNATQSGPTIFILPGPHKTGSTSIQTALYQWLNSNSTHGWAYPVPTAYEFEAVGSSSEFANGKGFSPMITRLFVNPEWSGTEVIQKSPLLQLYQRKIKEAWEDGKNIVIASEHLDRLVREPVATTTTTTTSSRRISLTPEALWNRFLALLPSSSNVVIGLTYRTPRIDHLLSLWHHVGHEPLAEFITKPKTPGLVATQHSLNSLGLADFFVRQGYTVRLVEGGGRNEDGWDLPTAVVCHVLKSRELCGPRTHATLSPRYNVLPEPADRNIDNRTLQDIDNLLIEHDCHYQHLKAEWVYGANALARCRSAPTRTTGRTGRRWWRRHSFSETIQTIIHMVCQRHPTHFCGSSL
jgi:hypothetical protein